MAGPILPIQLLCLALGACADPSSATPDLVSGDSCAPYGTSTAAGCLSQVSYATGTALPHPRDHHGTAIAVTAQGAFLYVGGGTDYASTFKDMQVAAIAADGNLSPFSAVTELPHGRAGHGVVVHGDRMFLVGGRSNGFLKTAISTVIHADGSLGAWDTEPPLPAARFHLAVVASDTHAYAIGGMQSDSGELPYLATSDVFMAAFLPDGHLGPWQSLPPLPEPRSHHAAVVHEGHIYLVGGLVRDNANGSPMATDVLSATLSPDGTPGAFTVTGQLPAPVSAMATFAAQGVLYVVGGLDESDEYVGRVRRAQLLADGQVGAFSDLAELPEGRSHVHQTPYHHGRFYSTGGSTSYQGVTDATFIGSLAPAPSLAHMTVLHTTRPLSRAPSQHAGARCGCGKSRISIPR